jgi:hypothetical protein
MIFELNANFESGTSDPPPSIWQEWLWGCDLLEPASVDCLLNRSHLLGLLIARVRALREPELVDVCISVPNTAYANSRVSALTARQLQDTLQDLQMHWHRYVSDMDADALLELVDACMARFGQFNLGPTVYDDVSMRDAVCSDRMSVLCIRRFVTILCILYRHLDLLLRWVPPPAKVFVQPEPIQDFHVQASMEEFYKHTMHSDLPPAARMIYQQDFAGFYHCVSQVVYFHFPSYERRVQLDLAGLRDGSHHVFSLAPLLEMYPEINLCYEDEAPRKGAWNWIMACKRVYLMDGDGNVWFDENILRLLGAYLSSKSKPSASTPAAAAPGAWTGGF